MSADASPRIVHLETRDFEDPPAPFRTGVAGLVRLDADGEIELEERTRLSANTLHALEGHGVLDRLGELELEGTFGDAAPVLVRPSLVEDARSILYEADRTTYGNESEFVVARVDGDPPVEYRVAVANREYQVGLVRLIDVFNRASRFGQAVWLAL